MSQGFFSSLLRCAFNNYHMGVTAENVAAKFGLDRVSVFEKEAGGQ